jgi:O-methyltransferase involved in polyketide biosynthesis
MSTELGGVMETLLITLYIRAKDAKSRNPVINDQKSAEIIRNIDYDFKKFDSGTLSYYGVLARAKIMDQKATEFIKKYPDCVVVSVGCGLDTRFSRVDNGTIRWYNLDFPEVIASRERFFAPNEREINIAKSALDPSWPKDVNTNGKKLLILSEGMMMYLKEEEVKEFLSILTNGFDRFEAQFDLLYKGMVNKGNIHDTVKKTNARFSWGVKNGSEVTTLCPELKQTGLINFTDELKYLLPGFKKILIPFLYITNNRLGIYQFKKV